MALLVKRDILYTPRSIHDFFHMLYTMGEQLRWASNYDGRAITEHYNDVLMGAMASKITSLTVVYSTVYSGVDQRKHISSTSLALVRGIHWRPVNSPHKWPVTRKMFQFDDVVMVSSVTLIPHLSFNKPNFSAIMKSKTPCHLPAISPFNFRLFL